MGWGMPWPHVDIARDAEAKGRLAARRHLPQLRFHSPPSFMVSPRRGATYANEIIDLMSTLEKT
jgi:hypothetical protein